MNWTIEQRYQRIDDMPNGYFKDLIEQRKKDNFYPSFHIAPPCGLLNDPNGLSQFNGEHHIFYQWFPIGPTHGLKHWYHVSTKDFVHYTDHGVALYPDSDYDSHGVYSGGGLVDNQELLLFFTGNKRDKDWVREPTQCYASMNKQGEFTKHGVIVENSDYTEHFRDPKVWKEGDTYYMVVAAQTQELHGSMVLYRTKELSSWEHLGPIKTDYDQLGFMWECPDYFELDGKSIMLFSPQGVESDNPYEYKNIFSVSYILGDSLNKDKPELVNHKAITQPDFGFDFYAPQTYLDEQGRRIMYAWIGLPEIDTPSVDYQWTGLLTIPRELNVIDDMLIQTPLAELKALRKEKLAARGETLLPSSSFELKFEADSNFSLELSNEKGDTLIFEMNETEFKLDRSNNTHIYAEEYGLVRLAPRLDRTQNIQVFVDNSVLEIFINNGKHTMTSRFFIQDMNKLSLSASIDANLYPLDSIVGLHTNTELNLANR
ncbi:sucrose-6-phosphate hydrolase [Vibrio ishigakensis]|nr:sucrose-6-phosphate hydrolase [Vibrio ishigakensis]